MDLKKLLAELTACRGVSGDEEPVARRIAEAFTPLCEEVYLDKMFNVCARQGDHGPKIILCAHTDEIGMMATLVEDDGAIRFTRVGGVDPRILPASRVLVHTSEGPMTGIVGAVSPHLLSAKDKEHNYELDHLWIDLGLPADRVKQIVHPGTQIQLLGALRALENNRYSGKTLDDRASVAVLLRTAERLQGTKLNCQAWFVSGVQEEKCCSVGAETAAAALDPDLAIAIDVTHAQMPECKPDEVYPLDSIPIGKGSRLHPRIEDRLLSIGDRLHLNMTVEVMANRTATDADWVQIAGCGIPTGLINLPLKYMHTTVETISWQTVEDAASLLAEFLLTLNDDWEGWLCC